MIFVIGLALILTAATLVSIPLWRGAVAEVAEAGEPSHGAVHWELQKRQAYTAIREAELDLQMGKLAPADYQAIRAAEEARALEAMKALEPSASETRSPGTECAECGAKTSGEQFCAACGASSST